MNLAKEYWDLENKIQDTLKEMVFNSKHQSKYIAGLKALKVNVYDYDELVYHGDRLIFVDNDGYEYSHDAECTTEDLLEIIEENQDLLQAKHKVKSKDLYDFVAGLFISEENGMSPADQYDKLFNVLNIVGANDDFANEHVNVWQPFEQHTVEDVIDLIDDTVENMKEKFNFEEV